MNIPILKYIISGRKNVCSITLQATVIALVRRYDIYIVIVVTESVFFYMVYWNGLAIIHSVFEQCSNGFWAWRTVHFSTIWSKWLVWWNHFFRCDSTIIANLYLIKRVFVTIITVLSLRHWKSTQTLAVIEWQASSHFVTFQVDSEGSLFAF